MVLQMCMALLLCRGAHSAQFTALVLLPSWRQAKALRWKLSTRRADGAGDGFSEKHTELTAEELKDKETHLIKQVTGGGKTVAPVN